MTPKINVAHDVLSEAVENPESSAETLRKAGAALLVALLEAGATHRAVKKSTLDFAYNAVDDEANGVEGDADECVGHPAEEKEYRRDAKKLRAAARVLAGGAV